MAQGMKPVVLVSMFSTVMALGGVALAAPMEPVNDSWDSMSGARAIVGESGMVEGPPHLGQAFIDENLYFGSNLTGHARSMDGGGMRYLGRCGDFTATPCDTASMVGVQIILPACREDRTIDCVDGLYVRKDGRVEDAVFVIMKQYPDEGVRVARAIVDHLGEVGSITDSYNNQVVQALISIAQTPSSSKGWSRKAAESNSSCSLASRVARTVDAIPPPALAISS